MQRKHNPVLTPRAKELRMAMTEQEMKLWYQFLRNYPVRFLRQKVINHFVVDFYCASAKLVIELDGRQHCENDAVVYDSERTAVLHGYGLTVIRFTNVDVDTQFQSVCDRIHDEVAKKSPRRLRTARQIVKSSATLSGNKFQRRQPAKAFSGAFIDNRNDVLEMIL